MLSQRWLQNNLPFGPTINDNIDDPALPGITSNAATKRGVRVPLILGSNSNEGIFYSDCKRDFWFFFIDTKKSQCSTFPFFIFFFYHADMKYHDLNDLDRNLVNYLHPRILRTLEFHGMTVDDLKRLYFDGQRISNNNIDKLIKMWGDLNISNDVRHAARIQLTNANEVVPTYFYKFSYNKNVTRYKKLRRSTFKGF